MVSFYNAEKYDNPLIKAIHDYSPALAWTSPKENSNEFFLISGKDASASSGVTIFTKPAEYIGDRTLWINPKDAQRLGIREGDLLAVTSLDTKEVGQAKATITNRVSPGSLFTHSFQGGVRTKHLITDPSFDWVREGMNSNWLCPEYKEPLVGTSTNNTTVKVEIASRREA